ncbi:MAG: hypothetical protein ABI978_00265 [Chloroflexota bacterium]
MTAVAGPNDPARDVERTYLLLTLLTTLASARPPCWSPRSSTC